MSVSLSNLSQPLVQVPVSGPNCFEWNWKNCKVKDLTNYSDFLFENMTGCMSSETNFFRKFEKKAKSKQKKT
jgi:hypothetical protein